MEKVVSFEQIEQGLICNKILVDPTKSSLAGNSMIRFLGEDNILLIEDGVKLVNSTITFAGNHSVVYLSRNKHSYLGEIFIYNNSVVYIGEDCYFNRSIHIVASEQQNVVIGNEGLFSFEIYIRTADPHLIYDGTTKKRINSSASVFIGDHVWIGQNVLVLKGTAIGSGAIIGAGACVAGKKIPSNVSAAGNPVRIVRRNIFFLPNSVHTWTDEMTEKYANVDSDRYIYHTEASSTIFETVDEALKGSANAEQRLAKIQKLLVNNKEKNRFAIKEVRKKQPWVFWK